MFLCSISQLFNWALEPAEDDILDKLFELGYLDASIWAEDNPVGKIVQDDGPCADNGVAQQLIARCSGTRRKTLVCWTCTVSHTKNFTVILFFVKYGGGKMKRP